MAVSHVFLGGVRAFTLIPRIGNYDEVRDIAQNMFDLDLISRKKQEVANENASITIINESGVNGFDGKLKTLLDKFGYQTKISQNKNKVSAKKTIIYDVSNGLKPFSLEDLSKKLGAKIATNLPANFSSSCQGVDFCLIAGSDLTDQLNYEENSVTDLEKGYDQQAIDERQYIDLLKKGSNQKF